MVTTSLCTYFRDRATISGHDNPVFNNLADVQGKCCLVNIMTVSKNKKVITNEFFFLHHKFYTTHRTELKVVAIIMYGEASNVEPNTSLSGLKLFTQMDFINRVDLTASNCAKLSQKILSRLI